MYAIIKTGGKQYKVSEGDVLFIEKLDEEPDAKIVFDEIVAVSDGKNLKVGTPTVKGAKVEAKVIKNGRGKKLTIFTYVAKNNSKRKLGHRQPYTKVEIESIKA